MRSLYGAEIEVGRSMLEYMSVPGEREKAKGTFDRALAGEHVVELVCPETESRARRYLEISHHPVLASDGSVTGVAVFAADVTERQRAEDALRESEERYRLIAENTADTITVLDLDLRLVYVSPSVQKLRGFTVEEAMTHSLEQIFTPASLRDVHRLFAEQMALEESGRADLTRAASLELEEYCKDGSTIWVEIVVSFLRDASLRPTGILAVTRDVTRRKRADLRLVESEQKYRSLADSSPDNIIRYDAEARRVYVNRRTDASVGLGLGSRLGLTPAEGMPYPGAPAYEDKLRRVIQSGEPDEVEVSVPNPAGETRIHSIRFVAERSNDGRIIGALAFGRDVTEQKEAAREKQLYLVQLRQNLEDAVAAIAATVEARDPYTAGHQRRVAALAAGMAKELGLAEEAVQGIHLAGTIHDLGKIKIPAEILARPGQLSEIETRLIQIHPEAGWEILKGVEFPWPIAEMVLEHHERLDGSGYPKGLRGEQISQGARIIAVADVVEAMASHRPYRPSRGLNAALAQIESDRETLYDATVVDACLRLFREKGYRLAD
jgi:PAS domain S-box-containing protein